MSLATNDISINELVHFLTDDTSRAASTIQDLVEQSVEIPEILPQKELCGKKYN